MEEREAGVGLIASPYAAIAAAVVLGYGLGSVPFGFILTRMAGLGDIRAVGSGNIGATNVLRTGRKDIAALTLLLDGGKGTVAVLLAAAFLPGTVPALAAGVAAVLGHCTTPWMGGRGGKGVATGLGVFLGWSPALFLVCAAVWLGTAFLTRLSSAAALVAFGLAPLAMLLFRPMEAAIATLAVTAIMVWRHNGNIRRLMAGTEPRIGAAK